LDDFVFLDHLEQLVKLADIVKYKKYRPKLLAEKVETEDDHKFALDLGFELFQGFYFTKPLIKTKKDLMPYQASIVKALNIINNPSSEPEDIIKVIIGDLYLNTKLLSLVKKSHIDTWIQKS